MVPLPLSFSAPSQEVLGALDCCLEILSVFRPGVDLRKPHDRPCLAAAPRRVVLVALVSHFSFGTAGARIKVDEVVGGEVGT